jgi:hypothetical protein
MHKKGKIKEMTMMMMMMIYDDDDYDVMMNHRI